MHAANSARAEREPLAIVGIGCRFPDARGPGAFWQLLWSGSDAIRELPHGHPAIAAAAGIKIPNYGGVVERVDSFDSDFFGVSPREARHMDPQQRVALEVAWEALDDAGLVPVKLRGASAGVFFGVHRDEYARLGQQDDADLMWETGGSRDGVSGRISYTLGLEGPSLVVATDRSSSLVAVHLASQSLRAGECSIAIAGGVSLVLSPTRPTRFARAGMLASDGRCKFCDASADGIVMSDGVGVVVMKRLRDAIAEGDRIYAVVLGSAVNHDGGRSGDLMTPSLASQASLLRAAYRDARVAPADVAYVEAHGPGTIVGDPVEIGALAEVLQQDRSAGAPLRVGSVKTNIGHTEAAAGIAGLIKVALSIRNRAIPATLHYRKPNPKIDFRGVRVQSTREDWPADQPVFAGVTSLGLTGSNAHVVLGAPPEPEARAGAEARHDELLTLSAKNRVALHALAQAYADGLTADTNGSAREWAYTAAVRRSHYRDRLAVLGQSREELVAELKSFVETGDAFSLSSHVIEGTPKVAFIFSGQGSQWPGMGRELFESEPVFRQAMERCEASIRSVAGWSLLEEIARPAGESRLDETDFMQPAILAIGVSLAALWRSWGVEPGAVVGASMGEIIGAHVAGALSLDDAVRIICTRAKLMKRLAGRGAVALAEISADQARELIAPFGGRASIAGSYSRASTLLSGEVPAIEELVAKMRAQGITCGRVKMDVASHSPQMDAISAELVDGLRGIAPRPTSIPMYSTVTAAKVGGEALDAAYWVKNGRQPILFGTVIEALAEDGFNLFLEVSPHAILLGPTLDGVTRSARRGVALASLRRDKPERRTLLRTVADLYTNGCDIDWARLFPRGGRLVDAPSYPWQGKRYWYGTEARRSAPPPPSHPPPAADDTSPRSAPPARRSVAPARRSVAPPSPFATRLAAAKPEERKRLWLDFLTRHLANALGLGPSESVDTRRRLRDLGLTSLMAVELRASIERAVDRPVPPTLLFNHPTLEALADHLGGENEQRGAVGLLGEMLVDYGVLTERQLAIALEEQARAGGNERLGAVLLRLGLVKAEELQRALAHQLAEPIAVIGMACRFPGGANTPEAFWELLHRGVDAIVDVPKDRWDAEQLFSPEARPGKMRTKWGGFVENVAAFDAGFFGISPREAEDMDPQQRMLLEVTWQALERSAQSAADLFGSRTGVFVGIMNNNDYVSRKRLVEDLARVRAHHGTGTATSIAAGRIAYTLGLTGPAMAVDTACSSSLVAVHLAIQSLRNRECHMALAGGVNAILSPEISIAYSLSGMLSPDGRCKTFDASADGYVRSEGCGMIVLKRLSDAVADGDDVLAVLAGSAVNQDGKSTGLTAPSGEAQRAVIREALVSAGVFPAQVDYIEAHGTGTPLGDPIEMQALGDVMKEGRTQPVFVGSVKTNIGHLEAAAGIAGLMKVILMVQHGEIVPHLHLKKLNPMLGVEQLPVVIPKEPTPWSPVGRPRVAGVSSFGFSGTNAHVIVESAASQQRAEAEAHPPAQLLVLSARTPAALGKLVGAYDQHFTAHPELPWDDVCRTASAGREQFEERLAVVASSAEEAQRKLRAFTAGEPSRDVLRGKADAKSRPRVALLFTGQGSQYAGMGRDLYETSPVFRDALDECARVIDGLRAKPLLGVLFPQADGSASLLDETEYTQPALFALEYALYKLWQSVGLVPDAVLGHSVGEYVAACVAGVFSLEDGLKLIAERGRLMQSLPRDGQMISVAAGLDQLTEVLDYFSADVSVAAVNSDTQVVLSGRRDALEELTSLIEAQGLKVKALPVSHAFHSPLMDPILDSFERTVSGIALRAPEVTLVSNLTGEAVTTEVTQTSYWRRHVREAVQFARGMRSAHALGIDTFLEIGPQPTLVALGAACVPDGNVSWLPSLRKGHPCWNVLLESLGRLYVRGMPIDWRAFHRPYSSRVVLLPTYPFDRTPYWVDVPKEGARRIQGHFLLGESWASSVHRGTRHWENDLACRGPLEYLADHRIEQSVVLPAAAYVEIALVAGREVFRGATLEVEHLVIEQALVLSADAPRRVQVAATEVAGGLAVQISSRNDEGTWTRHATSTVRPQAAPVERTASLNAARARCTTQLAARTMYESLASWGLPYGPAFQRVTEMSLGEGEALALVRLDNATGSETYQTNPALLDGALQALVVLAQQGGGDELLIPVSVERVRVVAPLGERAWLHARLSADKRSGDVDFVDDAGRVLVALEGVRLKALRSIARAQKKDERFLGIEWRSVALERDAAKTVSGLWLVLGDGRGVGRALASRLEALGATVETISTQEIDQLADRVARTNPVGIVHLYSLDGAAEAPSEAALLRARDRDCATALTIVQALSRTRRRDPPRLWLVTAGTQPVGGTKVEAPSPALLWGLGRTIATEHPELRCTRVDVGAHPARGEFASEDIEALVHELLADGAEEEIAFRGGQRWVARLARCQPAFQKAQRQVAARGRSFRLETDKPGMLDRLRLTPIERRPPGPGEVEIEVDAASLNFLDVLKAMGIYPGQEPSAMALGLECAGTISAVGAGVTEPNVGDAVIGLAPGAFASHVVTSAKLVARTPRGLTPAEAASVPVVFLTAHYALVTLARLKKGERVLIHSATGGTGLAAIQVALSLGAEVFATAGSEEKRAYLKYLGVAHAMDSRSLAFADEILAATGGRGVDVVLNSLTGEAITKSMSVLAPYGRFVEIGKRDIYDDMPLGLGHFKKKLSYFAVDLAGMMQDRPDDVASLLAEVRGLFERGAYKPTPIERFPVSQAEAGFRRMAQAKHVGKLVFDMNDQDARITEASAPRAVRADASYLVTGGLGGLGLSLATWLADEGAKHLVLVSRSGVATKAQEDAVKGLEARGVGVRVVRADVSKRADVERVLAEVKPALAGVFHTAGVLDDALVLQQNVTRLDRVIAPKVLGAWHLHELTKNLPLDFFVLYSSVTALIGSAGQANYVAANAFLDALAHYRRGLGLPALAIDWGPFAEVGMAAREDRGARLEGRGLRSLTTTEAHEILKELLPSEDAQAGLAPLNVQQWVDFYPATAASSLWSGLIAEKTASAAPNASEGRTLLETLSGSTPEQARHALEGFVREQVGQVVRLDPSRIEPGVSFKMLGVDSLMGLELRNRMEVGLGLKLSTTLIWAHADVGSLVAYLADRLGLAANGGATSPAQGATPPPQHDEITQAVETLTDDEAEAELEATMGRLLDMV